jgi:hypothetical protein
MLHLVAEIVGSNTQHTTLEPMIEVKNWFQAFAFKCNLCRYGEAAMRAACAEDRKLLRSKVGTLVGGW